MAQSCKWNGMTKNLKNFLMWFQDNYPELGLTEIRMRDAERFFPHTPNYVTLTGDNGGYEAMVGIRDQRHQSGEEEHIVWTDPRPVE